jgi:hypothetical protein
VLGGEEEDLLERRNDDVDRLLVRDSLDVGDELLGFGPRASGDEVTREVLRMAPRRQRAVVGGVDLVSDVRELARHRERERHPRAGDQDSHVSPGAGLVRPKSPNG